MKTNELTRAALNWAVAKCEGYRLDLVPEGSYRPSTDWSQGGPIIEREGISTVRDEGDDYWQAVTDACSSSMFGPGLSGYNYEQGPTPLIAAMRCYVASKLGAEIDLPKELDE
jgi:hypothetical protein